MGRSVCSCWRAVRAARARAGRPAATPGGPGRVPGELARLDGDGEPDDVGDDIGRELFRLVAGARELGLDPEMEVRAAARRYRDRVHACERR